MCNAKSSMEAIFLNNDRKAGFHAFPVSGDVNSFTILLYKAGSQIQFIVWLRDQFRIIPHIQSAHLFICKQNVKNHCEFLGVELPDIGTPRERELVNNSPSLMELLHGNAHIHRARFSSRPTDNGTGHRPMTC